MEPSFYPQLSRNPKNLLIILSWCLLVLCFPLESPAEEKKITTDLGMTFIRVEPGNFIMGSPVNEKLRDADEIRHPVTITQAFYLQETEVTLEQWQAVMGKKWLRKRKGSPDSPVTRVSYYDCLKYIDKLNKRGKGRFRLPTEAEWEYACRAGTATAYSWGDAIDCSRAMYGNNTKKDEECVLFYESLKIKKNRPAPVKQFAPNPWGFYDMHGNVWEWCADTFREYLTGPADESYHTMKSDFRVRRGGSWYKYAHYLRSANRNYAHAGSRFATTGFRLVFEAEN